MRYREKQIARFKVIFPEIATGLDKKRLTRAARARQEGTGGECRDKTLGKTEIAEGVFAGPSGASTNGVSTARFNGGEASKSGGTSRRTKFSTDVAPAEMFMKDVGFTPAGVANHVRESSATFAEPMVLKRRVAIVGELQCRNTLHYAVGLARYFASNEFVAQTRASIAGAYRTLVVMSILGEQVHLQLMPHTGTIITQNWLTPPFSLRPSLFRSLLRQASF